MRYVANTVRVSLNTINSTVDTVAEIGRHLVALRTVFTFLLDRLLLVVGDDGASRSSILSPLSLICSSFDYIFDSITAPFDATIIVLVAASLGQNRLVDDHRPKRFGLSQSIRGTNLEVFNLGWRSR